MSATSREGVSRGQQGSKGVRRLLKESVGVGRGWQTSGGVGRCQEVLAGDGRSRQRSAEVGRCGQDSEGVPEGSAGVGGHWQVSAATLSDCCLQR